VFRFCVISYRDKVLFDEYDVVYEIFGSNCHIIKEIPSRKLKFRYIYAARSSISAEILINSLLSDICDREFSFTPVINNRQSKKMILLYRLYSKVIYFWITEK
jgi:hypothetical protein